MHGTGCPLPPAQLWPAVHETQVLALPAQATVVVDDDEYPALQVHGAGCAEPPAHTLPASQPVVEHVADVVTQALDVGTVEAHPGEHVHAAAWAPLPVQLKPAPHARHVPLLPEHAFVASDEEEYPALQLHTAGCADPPAHTLPAPQPVAEQVADTASQALDVVAVEAHPGEHVHATAVAPPPAHQYPAGQGTPAASEF